MTCQALHISATFGICLALASPVRSQDLEFFEVDDFITPAQRSTSSGEERRFLLSRFYTGFDRNYTYRNEISGEPMKFARVLSNYYFADYQLTVDLTRFWRDDFVPSFIPSGVPDFDGVPRDVPTFRARLQFGGYLEGRYEYEDVRYRFSWNMEKQSSGQYIHEVGIEYGLRTFAEEFDAFGYGSLIYSWTPSQQQHYFGLGVRQVVWQSGGGSRLFIAEGTGVEVVAGDWRLGVSRFQTGLSLALPGSTSIHFLYSFGGVGLWPIGQDQRFGQNQSPTNEAGIFFSVPIVAKIL